MQDPNVEHLLPHKNGKCLDRKFDWENLFWSCGHCNAIKNNGKYDTGIIDCCREDPENYLNFEVKNNNVVIQVKDLNREVDCRTAMLITETFSLKNTGMRIYTSDIRWKLLLKEMIGNSVGFVSVFWGGEKGTGSGKQLLLIQKY